MGLPRIVDTADLSAALSVDERSIRRLVRKGVLQRGEMGFDLVASIAAFVSHREKVISEQAGSGEYGAARAEYTREKAHAARLQREALEGKYLLFDDVLAAMSTSNLVVRNQFLALPTREAPLLAQMKKPAEIKAHLDARVREILTNLANAEVIAIRPRRGRKNAA